MGGIKKRRKQLAPAIPRFEIKRTFGGRKKGAAGSWHPQFLGFKQKGFVVCQKKKGAAGSWRLQLTGFNEKTKFSAAKKTRGVFWGAKNAPAGMGTRHSLVWGRIGLEPGSSGSLVVSSGNKQFYCVCYNWC